MKLSLVVPTYKKEDIVVDQLERLYGYLSRKNPDFELIFVIDGYVDNTKNILDRYIEENRLQKVKVVGYKQNRGKGYAIRYGMKKATGDVVGFTDADMDIQIRTLGYALKEIRKNNVDVVVPSKFHKDSNVELSFKRKIFSFGLLSTNKMLLNIPKNVSDIGCGLKLFKKNIIKIVLPNLKVNRFAVDSEILNEIGKLDCNVVEIPFFLNKNRSDSTSTNVKEIINMFEDILLISQRENYNHFSFRLFKNLTN